MFETLTE